MKRGILTEDAVIARLSRKVDMKTDPVIDHQYKLDFVIDRIRDISRLIHVGIQLTTNPTDMNKKAQFIEARKTKRFVDRSLYVEIEPEVDTDSFGTELIYNAIVAFAFNTDMTSRDILGVHIANDVSYTFFDIVAQVEDFKAQQRRTLQKNNTEHAAKSEATARTDLPPTKNAMSGKVTRYNQDRGFGLIEATDASGLSQKWWFHISSCEKELKDLLQEGNIEMEVAFTDAGYTKEDVSLPTAKKISVASTREMTLQ